MPEILTAMRIGIGFGWTTLVAAEMVAATEGLGFMVLTASQFLQTSTVIMGIFVIAIIAYSRQRRIDLMLALPIASLEQIALREKLQAIGKQADQQ